MDAASRKPGRRLDIARWITDKDFETVCDFADINPDALFEKIRDILLSDWAVAVVKAKSLRRSVLQDDPDLEVTRGE